MGVEMSSTLELEAKVKNLNRYILHVEGEAEKCKKEIAEMKVIIENMSSAFFSHEDSLRAVNEHIKAEGYTPKHEEVS